MTNPTTITTPEQPTPLGRPVYRYVVHAAHSYTDGAPLWDLEIWTVQGAREDRAPGIPVDAEYTCGFLEAGIQYSKYARKAPASRVVCPGCWKQ